MKNISIIGNGNFGKYIKQLIDEWSQYYKTFIGDTPEDFPQNSDMFILAVPISALEEVVEKFKPLFRNECTVVDVCSVKLHSQKVLESANLDSFVIHTHPLFGPQSAPILESRQSAHGQSIVICGKTNDIFDELINFLGLHIIPRTAREHDIAMANSQVINHLVGRTAKNSNINRNPFSTVTHDKFMDIVDIVGGNDVKLFRDMVRFNPYAMSSIEHFIEKMFGIRNELEMTDRDYENFC